VRAGLYNDFTHELLFTDVSMRQVLHAMKFRDIQVTGTDIYVFGGIMNYASKILAKLHFKLQYLVCWMLGRKSNKIFTKDILAIAKK
jgi:hypothetical protein